MSSPMSKQMFKLMLALMVATLAACLQMLLSLNIMNMVDMAMAMDVNGFGNMAYKVILIVIIYLPVKLLAVYFKGKYKACAMISYKSKFLNMIFKKNIAEFNSEDSSKYVSVLTNDMNTVETNYFEALYEFCYNVIFLAATLIIFYYINHAVMIAGLCISVLSLVLPVFINKRLKKHQEMRVQVFEKYTKHIKEVLSSFQIIKTSNLADKMKSEFASENEKLQERNYLIEKIYSYMASVQYFISNVSMVAILAVVAYMSLKGHVTAGGIIVISNNMDNILNTLIYISEWFPKILSVKPVTDRIHHIADVSEESKESVNINDIHNIDLKKLSFGYDDRKNVLKDINISFNKGRKYLILGKSGSGKSTLVKLLRKYYVPREGSISVDDMDLSSITKETYFSKISVMDQNVFLFEDTVYNNITLFGQYGAPEVDEVINKAGLRSFVDRLPLKEYTIITDNGRNISGGEKSRIVIARTLLGKASVVILDEAFSSLDSQTAREIERELLELKDILLVNVSHIIFNDTKDKYDDIYYLENGYLESIKSC